VTGYVTAERRECAASVEVVWTGCRVSVLVHNATGRQRYAPGLGEAHLSFGHRGGGAVKDHGVYTHGPRDIGRGNANTPRVGAKETLAPAVEASQSRGAAGYANSRELQGPNRPARFTSEMGLFWAVASAHRRRGYAAEAGGALVTYAFDTLGLLRVVATTRHDNVASIGVMRKLGMRVLSNPLPEPRWFQAVGVVGFDEWSGPERALAG